MHLTRIIEPPTAIIREKLTVRLTADNCADLAAEITAWEARRNAHQTRIAWRFTTADARIKRRHLNPSL